MRRIEQRARQRDRARENTERERLWRVSFFLFDSTPHAVAERSGKGERQLLRREYQSEIFTIFAEIFCINLNWSWISFEALFLSCPVYRADKIQWTFYCLRIHRCWWLTKREWKIGFRSPFPFHQYLIGKEVDEALRRDKYIRVSRKRRENRKESVSDTFP